MLDYEWQIDTDGSFSSVPPGFQGSTQNTQVRLPALDPNTTYFWRVRTATPVLGSWSTPRSWSTTLDMEASPLRLESPKPGDSAVPVRPLFQWAPVIQADAYELVVSREAALTNPVIARQGDSALVTTSWDCNVSLDYSAKYFWKVRGVTATTRTAWSGTGSFTTVPAAAPAPTPAPVQPAPLNPPPSSAAARPSQPPTDGYDRTRDAIFQPLTYPDKTVPPSSPPVVVVMPSPELPTWMTWFILGQVAITLGLIVALVVVVMLALRKRSS